jgi:hypothetical protein
MSPKGTKVTLVQQRKAHGNYFCCARKFRSVALKLLRFLAGIGARDVLLLARATRSFELIAFLPINQLLLVRRFPSQGETKTRHRSV